MARLLFVITHSTDLPDRSAAALHTAHASLQEGLAPAVWLTGEGVRLGVQGVVETLREPGAHSAAECLERIVEAGGVLYCDRPSFERREFEEDALRAGARLAEPSSLSTLVAEGWIPVPT